MFDGRRKLTDGIAIIISLFLQNGEKTYQNNSNSNPDDNINTPHDPNHRDRAKRDLADAGEATVRALSMADERLCPVFVLELVVHFPFTVRMKKLVDFIVRLGQVDLDW